MEMYDFDKVVDCICWHGIDLDKKENKEFINLSHEYKWEGHDGVTRLNELISEGIDVYNLNSDYKETGLHLACRNGNVEILKFLVNTYKLTAKDMRVRNWNKSTPLHYACSVGSVKNPNFLKELLNLFKLEKSDFTAINKYYDTPISLACSHLNHEQITHIFEIMKLDRNSLYYTDRAGNTLMHRIYPLKDISVLRELQVGSYKACYIDVTTRNKCGLSPILIACKKLNLLFLNYCLKNFKLSREDFCEDPSKHTSGDFDGNYPIFYLLICTFYKKCDESILFEIVKDLIKIKAITKEDLFKIDGQDQNFLIQLCKTLTMSLREMPKKLFILFIETFKITKEEFSTPVTNKEKMVTPLNILCPNIKDVKKLGLI